MDTKPTVLSLDQNDQVLSLWSSVPPRMDVGLESSYFNSLMASFAELLRSFVAALFRRRRFKGGSDIYKVVNQLTLRLNASPIARVTMNRGHQMMMDLRAATQRHAFYRGEYDEFFLDCILSLLEADSVVLDVGANIGFYSIPIAVRFSELGGAGKVFAFEPFGQNMARLKENADLNAVTTYIEMCAFGLSSQTGWTDLALRGEFASGSTTGNASVVISEDWDSGLEKVSVDLQTLDSLIAERQLDRIDIIKLDIEGHEDHFFIGGAQALRATRPIILMEVNKPYYRARGLWNVDSVLSPAIPEHYAMFRRVSGRWERVVNLNECPEIGNIFLVPEEKDLLWRQRISQSASDPDT